MPPLTSDVQGSERLVISSGRNYLVIAIDVVIKETDKVRTRARLVRMCPDFNDLGSSLGEAEAFREAHNQLSIQYNSRKNEVTANASREGHSDRWDDESCWSDVTQAMEQRKSLLDHAIAFYASEKLFVEKLRDLEQSGGHILMPTNEEDAKNCLQKHLELRKNALESCMGVVRCSQSLFDRLGTVRTGPHPTTAGCKAVELPMIQVKLKCHKLEEQHSKRASYLRSCLTFAEYKQSYEEIKEIATETQTKFIGKEIIGESLEETQNYLKDINADEKKINNCVESLKGIACKLDLLKVVTTSDIIGQFKNEVDQLDSRCDHLISILNNRRRNLKLANRFYALTVEGEIELDSLIEYSTLEPLRKLELSETGERKCAELLYISEILLTCINQEENKTIFNKKKMIESKLESLKCENSAEKSPIKSVKTIEIWLERNAEQLLIRDCYLPEDLASIHQLFIESKTMSENIKLKRIDLENIASAPQLEESLKTTVHGCLKKADELVKKFDWRSHAALSAIKLQKTHRQLSVKVRSFEDFQHKLNNDISNDSLHQLEERINKIISELNDFLQLVDKFIEDMTKGAKDASINTHSIVRNFTENSEMLKYLKGKLPIFLEEMKKKFQHVEGNIMWENFNSETFKTISWIICIEDGFFPMITGQVGSSFEEVKHFKKRLEDFQATIDKADAETGKLLKIAELASMGSQPSNYSKHLVQDLMKTHSRFAARVGEYKYLLGMAEDFFSNLEKLDNFLTKTEHQFKSIDLKKPIEELGKMRREEEAEQHNVMALMLSAADVANEVIIRVRQKNANIEAGSNVRRLLEVCTSRQLRFEED